MNYNAPNSIADQLNAPDPEPFSEHEQQQIDSLVAQVPENVKEDFNAAYDSWLEFCRTPRIMLSSNSKDRGQGETFERLVQMGRDNPQQIMPLLVRKLMDSEQFMAHNIFGRIKEDTHFVLLPQREAKIQARSWLQDNSQ